jgi:hypothetical protein
MVRRRAGGPRGDRAHPFGAIGPRVKPEAAKATFKEGILTLTLPKTEQVQPKHVKVETA